MHDIAVVLGGADCVWHDLAAFEEMVGVCISADDGAPGVTVVCTNDMGWFYPGHFDVWATLHAEKMAGWNRRREGRGYPRSYVSYSSTNRTIIDKIHQNTWTNGSSSLYAVKIARDALGFERIVGCGMPMDNRPNVFTGAPWRSFRRYRKGWKVHKEDLEPVFRSFSGYTHELFGAPDPEWLGVRSLDFPQSLGR